MLPPGGVHQSEGPQNFSTNCTTVLIISELELWFDKIWQNIEDPQICWLHIALVFLYSRTFLKIFYVVVFILVSSTWARMLHVWVYSNVSSVVQFERWWVLKNKIFGQESTQNCTFKVNFWSQKSTDFFQK